MTQEKRTNENINANTIYSLFELVESMRGIGTRVRHILPKRLPRKPNKPSFRRQKLHRKTKPVNLKPAKPVRPVKPLKLKLKVPGLPSPQFKTSFEPFKKIFANFNMNKPFINPLKSLLAANPFNIGNKKSFNPPTNRVYVKRTFLSNRLIIIKPPGMENKEKVLENTDEIPKNSEVVVKIEEKPQKIN